MSNTDKDIDDLITEALDAEDRELLGRHAHQPGFFSQALGIFSGSMGWVMAVVMLMVFVFLALMIWTGLEFFRAEDTIMALRWGLGSVVTIQILLFLRGVLFQQILTNQVLREVKRLELQVVRAQHRQDA